MLSLKNTLFLGALLVLGGCWGPVILLDELHQEAEVRRLVSDAAVDAPKTDFVVDKTFDQAWKDLAILALRESFAIDDYDKASGSMTLRLDRGLNADIVSFRQHAVPRFIECFPPAYDQFYGQKVVIDVAIEPLNEAQTRLTVKARYWVHTNGRIFRFDTGKSATRRGPPSWFFGTRFPGTKTTCRPTHLAERTIIDGIKKGDALEPSRDELAAMLRVESHPLTEGSLRRSAAIREELLGKEHIEVARAMTGLADFYLRAGRYPEAEALYTRALAILERARGPEDADLAPALDGLGAVYQELQRYPEAEATHRLALQLREKALGQDHIDLVPTLNDLAAIYRERQRFAEAETIYRRVLAIREETLGVGHPEVDLTRESVVALYRDQGKFTEVEVQYMQTLAAQEKALGVSHSLVDRTLGRLEQMYRDQGEEAKIEDLYKRELSVKEKSLGPGHPAAAEVLSKLADFYRTQGRHDDAESTYKRKLALHEKASRRAGVAESLGNLAQLYDDLGRPTLAEEFRNEAWELSSPYCYEPEANAMSTITPQWAECPSRTVFASRSEYAEWKASKVTFGEKFRRREAAE